MVFNRFQGVTIIILNEIVFYFDRVNFTQTKLLPYIIDEREDAIYRFICAFPLPWLSNDDIRKAAAR